MNNNELCSMHFEELFLKKQRHYVKWNEAVVENSSVILNIDLGTCASVVLVGVDENKKYYLGANHLFKSRAENSDISLEQLASLINSMKDDKKCVEVQCLGLFGAGYRPNSIASKIAHRNVVATLEALSLYGLSIEIFQTGYSQGVSVLYCEQDDAFIIRCKSIEEKEKKYYQLFPKKIFACLK